MTLRLNGSISGYSELSAPSVAGDQTFTLPGSNGSANNLLKNSGTAGTLEFASNVNIDSSGRLLVGTSTSSGQGASLQVVSSDQNVQLHRGLNDNNPATLVLSKSRNTAYGSFTIVQNGDLIGSINFRADDGTDYATRAAQITCEVDGTPGADDMPGRLVFSTCSDGSASPSERMRISQNGNTEYRNCAFVGPITDNATLLGGAGYRWSQVWAANGTIQTSDQRTKTAIKDSTLGSDFVKALHPVSYKWIEGGKQDTGERDEDGNHIYESVLGKRTHWGFIAQEVKEAVDDAGVDFGGWVLTDKDDPDSQQALRYDQFIAPLTKALQEALAEIDVLKAKVAALEAS